VRSSKEHATLAEPVSHPLRVRILEVLNERDMSPSEFVEAGHADFFFGHRPNVSHLAYHFRELADFKCLEAIDWKRSRGSVATTYRGVARAEFGDEEWAELPPERKRQIARTVAQGLMARIDGAFMSQTFLKRDDYHLTWFAMELDERGWSEVHDALALAFHTVAGIREDSKARLQETGEPGVPATAGIVFFESPETTPIATPGTKGARA
jgi:hypothetical protein